MTKNFLKFALPSFLIVSLLAPQFAAAQVAGMATAINVRQAMQELSQKRQQEARDTSPCEPWKASTRGLSNTFQLQNIISQGIQQNLAQTLQNTISQNLANIVNQQLAQNLPNLIEQGLSQQLPALLHSKLQGLTPAQQDAQGPRLLQESVQELLPGILQSGLPSMLQDHVGQGLAQQLGTDFQSQIPSILQNSVIFMGQMQEMMSQTFGAINDVISGNADPMSLITSLISRVTTQIVDGVSKIAGNVIERVQTNIISGVGEQAGNGLAQGDGIQAMTQRMMPVIMQQIMGGNGRAGMMQQIPGASTAGLNSFGLSGFQNASQGFSFSSWAGNNVTAAAGFDLAPVSQAIAHPLSMSLVSGLGPSGYDKALGNLAAIGYQGEPTIGALQNASNLTAGGMDYAYRVGYNGPLTASAVQGLNAAGGPGATTGYAGYPAASTLTTPGIADSLGADAAGNINPSTIANNSVTGLGIGDQIGASLTGGLVNGLSGGIGNLVDGVPYVGGLLSPIAEDLVQTTLYNLVGYEVAVGGLITRDEGVRATVASGFRNSLNIEAKSESHLKEANKQREEQIKTQQKELAGLVADCMRNKAAQSAMEDLQVLYRVDNGNAIANAARKYGEGLKRYADFAKTAAPARFGGPEAEGRSIVANLKTDTEEAKREAILKIANQYSMSDDPHDQAIANQLTNLAYNGALSGAENNDPYNYGVTDEQTQRNDDLINREFAAYDAATRAGSEAAARKAAEIATNNGFRNVEECQNWATDKAGNKFCNDDWIVKTLGFSFAGRETGYSMADILRAVFANGYKQDATDPYSQLTEQRLANGSLSGSQIQDPNYNPCPGLAPCPTSGQSQSGYNVANNYYGGGAGGYSSPYSFGNAFSTSLNGVLTSGANNISGQISGWTNDQINSFTNNITNGLSGAGFTGNDFQTGNEFNTQTKVTTIVMNNLSGLPAITDQIVQMIVEAIMNLIRQANPTP
jgi:hypothetical protein